MRAPTCARLGLASVALLLFYTPPAAAQAPVEGEVRQIVTFAFQPGRSGEALAIYRDEVLPLYREDEALLSFRAFRELESPVPMDLAIVRAFEGMAGMDASGASLRSAAERAQTSVGALYGRISALSVGHTDEFVAFGPGCGEGDPSASRITAFVRLRAVPGERAALERVLHAVARLDAELGVASTSGRFLIASEWDVLRLVGFDDLGAVQDYLEALDRHPVGQTLSRLTAARSVALLGSIPEFAIR